MLRESTGISWLYYPSFIAFPLVSRNYISDGMFYTAMSSGSLRVLNPTRSHLAPASSINSPLVFQGLGLLSLSLTTYSERIFSQRLDSKKATISLESFFPILPKTNTEILSVLVFLQVNSKKEKERENTIGIFKSL